MHLNRWQPCLSYKEFNPARCISPLQNFHRCAVQFAANGVVRRVADDEAGCRAKESDLGSLFHPVIPKMKICEDRSSASASAFAGLTHSVNHCGPRRTRDQAGAEQKHRFVWHNRYPDYSLQAALDVVADIAALRFVCRGVPALRVRG